MVKESADKMSPRTIVLALEACLDDSTLAISIFKFRGRKTPSGFGILNAISLSSLRHSLLFSTHVI